MIDCIKSAFKKRIMLKIIIKKFQYIDRYYHSELMKIYIGEYLNVTIIYFFGHSSV